MAETTKRQRSTSNSPEPDAKRPNVENTTQKQSTNSSEQDRKSPKMASTEADNKPEADAVDLGPSDAHIEVPAGSDPKNEETPGSLIQDFADQSAGDGQDAQASQISMRALIVTGDASIIIGKQGKHINEIRDKSGARLNIVSPRVPSGHFAIES